MRTISRVIESAFETFLFNSRLIVILAVLGSLTSSVLMFVRGAIMIVHSAKDFAHHWNDAHSDDLSIALISSVDSFLFATVLLIFAMGIYELFISKIDPASRTEDSRPNWLQIHSLDDLKGAVGKVILMILIVRLFESAVKMKYDHPLHLLYLGLAVLFVAAALYLQHLGHKKDHGHAASHDEAPSSSKNKTHAADKHEGHEKHPAAPAPAPIAPHYAPQAFAPEHAMQQPMQPYPTLAPPAPPPFPRFSETMQTAAPLQPPPAPVMHDGYAAQPSYPPPQPSLAPPTMEVPSSALSSLPMSFDVAMSQPAPQPQAPTPPRPAAPAVNGGIGAFARPR